MPAGVAVIRQKGKTVLAGTLSYFRISTDLCSLCQEMNPRVQKNGESARQIQGRNQGKVRTLVKLFIKRGPMRPTLLVRGVTQSLVRESTFGAALM